MSNTVRTILGFLRSAVERKVPFLQKTTASLADIYNCLPVSELVVTSGQPNEAQLRQIVSAGYLTVVNLAPTSMLENSIVEERSILEQCGAHYVHIPVDFNNPTEHDFDEFVTLMSTRQTDKIWIHCAANMRVSAFLYRYRCSVLGHDAGEAKKDLLKIWEPFGVWRDFIKR